MSNLEKNVVKRILTYLRSDAVGAYANKTHGSPLVTRGTPDIIGCIDGRYLALEVKVDSSGKPTKIQAYQIMKIREAGGIAEVVWSVDQVKAIVKSIRSHKDRGTRQGGN